MNALTLKEHALTDAAEALQKSTTTRTLP